jgi:hypothetical protein
MLTIPQITQSDFFQFRFSDDSNGKRRSGCLVPVKDCLVSSYDTRQGKYRDYSWDEFKAKYANKNKTTEYKSAISHCFICGRQADLVLLYKYTGCMIKEKYCSSCAEKRIIKL